ncbi:MAG: DUF2182 domain-containing protein [Rhodospirillales bacterium]
MIEATLKRDRMVVLVSLVALTALAWVYLVILGRDIGGMPSGGGTMMATALKPWTALDFALILLMWSVMMVGMMLPSAAPMILLFAGIARQSREPEQPFAPVGVFICGYVLVWTAFSIAATVLQWGLEQAALLSPSMVSASPYLGGGLLMAAGVYQLIPLKDVCLRYCRTPAGFLFAHWRPGAGGAFHMGVAHGAFCVGCCWMLMGLLFVGGVMNLLWVAAIAFFVLIEKVAAWGATVGRLGGMCLIVAGLVILIHG